MGIFIIEVMNKKKDEDIFGKEIKKNIKELGIFSVKEVRVSDLYKFCGNLTEDDIKEIAENVMIDKVSQTYKIYKEREGKKGYIVVEVWYKKGVTDTTAETTKYAVSDYGIKKKFEVATGKKYYLKGEFKEGEIKNICERILSNTLIQDYLIIKNG